MRAKIVFVLAIVMGLVTTYLFIDYMKRFDETAAANETLVEALVAKQPIKKNQRIGAGMVEVVKVPKLGLHAQALTAAADAEGKFAEADLAVGEVILSSRVKSEKDEAALVARKVTEGMRAVAVGVNFVQSVSNLIEPEDRVDVVVSIADKVTNQVNTSTVVEQVRVLAVGRRMVESGPEAPYAEYSSVTLEVKPQEVLPIVNADEKGEISLVLHSRIKKQ